MPLCLSLSSHHHLPFIMLPPLSPTMPPSLSMTLLAHRLSHNMVLSLFTPTTQLSPSLSALPSAAPLQAVPSYRFRLTGPPVAVCLLVFSPSNSPQHYQIPHPRPSSFAVLCHSLIHPHLAPPLSPHYPQLHAPSEPFSVRIIGLGLRVPGLWCVPVFSFSFPSNLPQPQPLHPRPQSFATRILSPSFAAMMLSPSFATLLLSFVATQLSPPPSTPILCSLFYCAHAMLCHAAAPLINFWPLCLPLALQPLCSLPLQLICALPSQPRFLVSLSPDLFPNIF